MRAAEKIGIRKAQGLDVDPARGWTINDSLKRVPKRARAIIITNPPYLTNYSASRKGLAEPARRYFRTSRHDDLYKIALEKCLDACPYVVAIIPETFINSAFPKARLASVTVLEDNPFDDTDTPVCVACFD